MAVPSSGALSLFGIAKEVKLNDYNNTIPPSTFTQYQATISLGQMSTGGGNYPDINTNNPSSDRPDGSTPHQMSEFYSYDHDAAAASQPILVYQSSLVGDDPIYTYTSSGIWDDGGTANYTTKEGEDCSDAVTLDTGAKSSQSSDHYIYFDIQNVNGDTYYISAFTVYFKWTIGNYQYLNVEIGTYERNSSGLISYTNSSSILSAGGSSGTSSTGTSSLSVPGIVSGTEEREGIYFKASRGYGPWSGDITIYDINTNYQCDV